MTASGAQLETLANAVAAHFDLADLGRAVRAILDMDLESISTGGDKIEISFDLVDWANRRSKLIDILDGLKNRNPSVEFHGKIDAVLDEMNSPVAASGDPLKECLIDGEVFITRDNLNTGIGKIIGGGHFPKKISTVSGPDATGKTYSWTMISYVARAMADAVPIKIDLGDRDDLDDWTPEELMRSLAHQMELDISTIIDLTESDDDDGVGHSAATGRSRRARYVGDWLVGKLNDDEKDWWIVIDGLELPGIPNSTFDLVEILADLIADRRITNVRLFLLGYGRVPSQKMRRFTTQVPFQLITENDVRDHARNLVSQFYQGEPDEMEARATEVANGALDGLNGLTNRQELETMTVQFQLAAERLLS